MSQPDSILSTVLNVDDFEPGRYARTRVLTQAGYEVLEAGTGQHALELARERRPPLVILDVNLPDINGLEVCQTIKSDPRLARVMVLQISALAIRPADRVRALDMGADAYLVEPVEPAVLIATVRALLRLAESDRKLHDLNEELRRSNDDLARFAYVASHDLQEPLRTITAYTQLLERRYRGQMGGEAHEFIRYITDAASRMSALIRDLLAYSQVGSRREHGPVDLNAVLQAVLRNLHAALLESQARIDAADLPRVQGDEEQLVHVFQNILSNAIKYRSDRTPEIGLSAVCRDSMWQISIRDNGRGFGEQYAIQVFEAFRRLDHSEHGTGIGLAIARRIVETHGGQIWAESQPGAGSTFHFTLPPVAQE